MGPEPIMALILLVSLLVCVVRAGINLWRGEWLVLGAIVLGMAVGLAPYMLMSGPAIWPPLIAVTLLGTLTVLVSALLRHKRWEAIAAGIVAASFAGLGLLAAIGGNGVIGEVLALTTAPAYLSILAAPAFSAAGLVALLAILRIGRDGDPGGGPRGDLNVEASEAPSA